MGWFGSSEVDSSKESSLSSYSSSASFDNVSNFDGDSSLTAIGGSFGVGGDFQDQIVQLSQQAMVQALMFKLTERGFEHCVVKPTSSLSSSEQSCMKALTSKYMESSAYIMQRIQRQQK